jgi:SPP1 gp7 family putative phage head morphogenesis protein
MAGADGGIDPAIRHQIFVQRFGAGEWRRLLPVLRQMERDIVARLNRSPTETQALRLISTLADIRRIALEMGAELNKALQADMVEFAEYEGQFTGQILAQQTTAQVALPTLEQYRAAVTTSPAVMVTGKTVSRLTIPELVGKFAGGRADELVRLVRAGALEGKTIDEISREVRRVVKTRTMQQAQALVRTATNHIASTARQMVHIANADILAGERYVATLDSRTTLTCAGLDGKVFPVGQGATPPMHWGCRSTRVPVVSLEFSISPPTERSSVTGPVSSKLTYGGWLKRQPALVQDEILGPERAALFRSGRVQIGGFTDERGVAYTLKELRAREGLTLS